MERPEPADHGSGVLAGLLAGALVYRPEGGEGWAAVAARVGAGPGVVALEQEDGATLLMGVTADARAYLSGRLVAPEEEGRGKRADLSGVAARARVWPVGSGFEADLLYLALAQERLPGVYERLMGRWGAWGVEIDLEAAMPDARVVELRAAPGSGAALDPASTVGPVAQKHAPRLLQGIVDAFDLCRYPNILRQAPAGVACAYKEMGRCPAPCDGSESMDSYRRRVAAAAASMGACADERLRGLTQAMKAAAAGERFEEAAAMKRVHDRLKGLGAGAFKGVRTFAAFRHVVLSRCGEGVRCVGVVGGREVGVVQSGASPDDAVVARLGEMVGVPVAMPSTARELEALSVVWKWKGADPRRRVRVVTWEGDDASGAAALRRAFAEVSKGPAGEVVEEMESAAGGAGGADGARGLGEGDRGAGR